jgi:Flp pilus assembly protein TadD
MHQAGQLAPAAQLYQKVLAQEEENADALHLLGLLRHQQGQHQAAVEMISRAVTLRPNVPAFHSNLAEAYRALGQCERAAGCCRMALRLWPDYPEGHSNLGLALQGLGRHAEAASAFRRALELRPDFALAHGNLGITLRELGQILVDTGKAEEVVVHGRQIGLEADGFLAVWQILLNRSTAPLPKPFGLSNCEVPS